METIKILHIYYDLMNLYGEHGNIEVLTHHLENHNLKVITHYASLEDHVDFDSYDIIYIGSGNKESFSLVLNDLMNRKDNLFQAYQNKKFILATGNSLDLFGTWYHTLDGNETEALGLFDYESYEVKKRIVGEQVYHTKGMDEEIIGFVNRYTMMKDIKEPQLFKVSNGIGSDKKNHMEGIHINNFYGTYLLGPILVRNPYFTEYFIKALLDSKNIPYKYYSDNYELKAYQEYQKNLLNEK